MVHVSGFTLVDADGTVQASGAWAAQFDLCHEGTAQALQMSCSAAALRVEQNRPYGDGSTWFKDRRPVSMVCRTDSLADATMLVEVNAVAIIGAHADIE